MADQKLAAPYGDIVFVNTPNLDRMGAMIYNEEKQRKAAQAKADADLDNEFSKNIAGIHNADIPDLTKAWGDFKTARQSLIATKGGTTPEQQMAALQAKARVYDLISKSKLRKQTDLETLTDYRKNPLNYNEDAHSQFLADLWKPTSKLPQDYYNKYRYDGNTVDFSKVLDAAKGKVISGQQEVEDDPIKYDKNFGKTRFNPNDKYEQQAWDGKSWISTHEFRQKFPKGVQNTSPQGIKLERKVYDIKRFNNPTEYFHTVVDKVIGDKATNQFIRKYNVPQDQYNQVKDQYDLLISDPKIKSRFALQVDLPQESDLTPLTRAAKFLAMQHAIQNPPTTTLKPSIKDTKAIIDYKDALWNKHNKITFGQSMQKIAANKKAQQETPYLTDDYWSKYGKGFDSPEQKDAVSNIVGFTPLGYVNSNDIHPTDYETITGQEEVEPITVAGKSVFLVDENGDWIGAESKRIPRESVRNVVIEKRANTNHKIQQENKKNTFNTQKNKPTGTNDWKSRAKKK